jgi:DNA-binding NarL/FixJ family response regulator
LLSGQRHKPIRVLIADDDHRVCTALSVLLTSIPDFAVVGSSATTEGALTLARQHRPAVALIDILMPEAPDGLALLRALTDELHIPAIAMSINGGLKKSALAAGATTFFDKDGRADQLIAALHDLSPSSPDVPATPSRSGRSTASPTRSVT